MLTRTTSVGAHCRAPSIATARNGRLETTGETRPDAVDRIDGDVAIFDTGIARHRDVNRVGGASRVGGNYGDRNGHGLHVAGTVGAKDNRRAVIGVAPAARLWAVKVLENSAAGTGSSVIRGLEWVLDQENDGDPENDIEVVNMSLGGSGSDNS